MTLLAELETLVEPAPEENCIIISAANPNEGENELRWCPSLVTWSVGGIQRRKWAFKSHKQPVLAACFAWFDLRHTRRPRDGGAGGNPVMRTSLRLPSTFGPFALLREGQIPDPQERTIASCASTLCICICLRDVGHIFTHDGLEFIVNLPFAVEKIWPLNPVGLILKASLPLNPTGIAPFPFSASYFTLVTPHNELRPIVLGHALPHSNGLTPYHQSFNDMPSLDASETIIYVSSYAEVESQGCPPLVVAFSRIQKRLRIFYYRLRGEYYSTPLLAPLNRGESLGKPKAPWPCRGLTAVLERLAHDTHREKPEAPQTLSVNMGVDSWRNEENLMLHEILGVPLTETE